MSALILVAMIVFLMIMLPASTGIIIDVANNLISHHPALGVLLTTLVLVFMLMITEPGASDPNIERAIYKLLKIGVLSSAMIWAAGRLGLI